MKMIVPFSLSPSKIRPLYFSLVVFMFAGGLVHVWLHTLHECQKDKFFIKLLGKTYGIPYCQFFGDICVQS